ncbi:MAG: transposase [Planctomycetota bacterium]|jgi:REP element-mobilizing transposase RayT
MGERPVFQPFDRSADFEVTARNLPHWYQPGATTFITFRTADSLPKKVLDLWHRELLDWLERRQLPTSLAYGLDELEKIEPTQRNEFQKLRKQLWHQHLDDCHGACVLKQPELAEIVATSLKYFDGERYDLDSFVVMPNHVHLLVQFRPPVTMKRQVTSWLQFTATQINRRLGRKGVFWQSEAFDHLVRSAEQFEYLRRYIVENPVKAGLAAGEFVCWSREAS